jgi:sugar/nucleoside kinase (ribokinase family)
MEKRKAKTLLMNDDELLLFMDVENAEQIIKGELPRPDTKEIYRLIRESTQFAEQVVVTMGTEGILFAQEDGNILHAPIVKVNEGEVVDTTGAGDSVHAAWIKAILACMPPELALGYAARQSSKAIKSKGGHEYASAHKRHIDLQR